MRSGRGSFPSLSPPPPPFSAPGVTSLRYADLFTLTLFPRGSGTLGEAVVVGRGYPAAAPARLAGVPPRKALASLPALRVAVGTAPGF